MALEISYAPQFFDSLESILNFFDERNGSDRFSKKLLKMISKQILLLKTMPEIGRLTDTPGVRIIFVEQGILGLMADGRRMMADEAFPVHLRHILRHIPLRIQRFFQFADEPKQMSI